ncbi:hypothetical protein [Xanthomonas arboricola]|uniref:hypothetical protein n=1 Tax=Xanthomonas arboricola TaxID=56448 RepID=UPI003EBE1B86
MPFRDLNPIKLGYLLSFGTREGELRRFFSDSFKLLILYRARLRNPPSGRKERIRTILEKLPPSTDDVVQKWFRANVTVEMPVPVEEILEWFQVFNDGGGGGLPDEEARPLARSALVHLFSENPDDRLLSYLRKPPTAGTQEAENALQPQVLGNDLTEPPHGDTPGDSASLAKVFPQLVCALISGQDAAVDDLVSDLPIETRIFVDGLVGARNGAHHELEESISSLEKGTAEHDALIALRGRARVSAQNDRDLRQALQISVPDAFEGNAEEHWRILGITVKDLDPAIFVRPLAVQIDGQWRRVSVEERPRLFPESGDVMTHRTAGRRVPQVGEYVCWDVDEKHSAGGRVRMHFTSEVARVFEIVEVGAPSTDPDSIRLLVGDAVQGEARRSQQPLLFALSDGLIVAPRAGDPSKEDCFEQPWSAWSHAGALVIDGRLLHVGLPKGSPAAVDLAPIGLALKRLIRTLMDAGKASFTRRQINEICDLVDSDEAGFSDSRLKRLGQKLDLVQLDHEALGNVLSLLEGREDVQARVTSYVDAEVSRRLHLKESILSDVDAARRRKDEIFAEIKGAEKKLRQVQRDTRDAVGKTFDQALAQGISTLAKAEIFSNLSNRKEVAAATPLGVTNLLSLRTLPGTDDISRVISDLRALGVPRKLGVALCVFVSAIANLGLCLVLRGRMSRQAARILVRYRVENASVLDVPLGYTDSDAFQASIKAVGSGQALAVLNADCAPIDLYASSIIDALYDRVIASDQTARFILSTVDADVGIPVSKSLSAISLTVDLDRQFGANVRSMDEIDDGNVRLLPCILESIVAWLVTLEESDRDAVEWMVVNSLMDCGN